MTNNFYHLWVSQILSQVTVQMMNFLLLARLFAVTGSSIATSLLWIAYALPAIFFGPIGAATVDLVSRRKMLMITNLFQAITVFIYIFTHEQSVFFLYFVVIAYSFFNQFYVPAENASLPSVVSKNALPQANSLFFLTQQLSLVVGLGLAGVVQKFIGFKGSLILCSLFLFIAFLSVVFLPKMKPRKKIPESFEKLVTTFFASIIEGYNFIKGKKYILFPLLLLLGIQISLAMVFVNLPVIATQILNVAVSYAGILVIIPAAVGATLGSIFVTRFLKSGWRKKLVIEISLSILSTSVFLVIFLLPYISSWVRVLIAPILLSFVGFGFIGVNIPTLTFLQESTPVWLRGRVFGNLWFLVTIATVFPVLFSGVITEFFGVKTLLTFLLLGIIFALIYSRKNEQI